MFVGPFGLFVLFSCVHPSEDLMFDVQNDVVGGRGFWKLPGFRNQITGSLPVS